MPDAAVLAALLALGAGPVLARAGVRLADGYRAAGAARRRAGAARVALVTALLAAGWVGAVALTGPRPATAALVVAGAAAVVLGAVDLAVHRLPDRVTYPAAAAVAAAWLADAVVLGSRDRLLTAALAGLAALAAGVLAAVLAPEGLGFGDVKLLGLIGLLLGWFGWSVLAAGVLAGLVAGAVASLALVVAGRAGWRTAVPLGPALLLGAAAALALAGPVPLP